MTVIDAAPLQLIAHESRLLGGNPLGDATTRELALLLPPSYEHEPARRYPVIMVLAGYSSTGAQVMCNRAPWQPTLAQRLHAAMRDGKLAEAIVVAPDCFTRYGGAQYLDSPAIGPYQRYLADEIFPFLDGKFRTIPKREARAVVGKSSGGYGALMLGMLRPEVAAVIGSHAGDGAFELSYLSALGRTIVNLQRAGGIEAFTRWFEAQPTKGATAFSTIEHLMCAAAWSPSDGPYGFGRGFDFPLNPVTGALIDGVWQRWLARDPVRMLAEPRHLEAMRTMRAIFVDGGTHDEHLLNLAARQMAARLAQAGIEHTHEEFDGGHFNTPQRWDRVIQFAAAAVARD
jgi:enterochelin esterase family protein